MRSETAHECNMFIMKKEIYKNYCAWLFDILLRQKSGSTVPGTAWKNTG